MKKLFSIKYFIAVTVLLFANRATVSGQISGYYKSAEALVVVSSADSSSVHKLTDATLIMQKSLGRLTMNLAMPDRLFETGKAVDSILFSNKYQFKLTLKLDPVQSMENALSTNTLKTSGYVTINNITKRVPVEYSPILTGTDKTDYNLFLRVRFDAADFNLLKKNRFTQYTIILNNAPLNFL